MNPVTEPSPYRWQDGLRDGLPIGLGYLSVSFGFGISAVSLGLPAISAILTSLTNLTSAGQMAGIAIIASGGSLMEMAAAQFVINLRYALMSFSLTQKVDDSFTLLQRMILSFLITDEIFAVSSTKEKQVGARYFYGLGLLPILGWVLGTALGAFAGMVLPQDLTAALGIMIYGMFLAILIPPAKKERGVLAAVVISAAMSCCIRYIGALSFLSSGFSIILCAVTASAAAALLRPVEVDDE